MHGPPSPPGPHAKQCEPCRPCSAEIGIVFPFFWIQAEPRLRIHLRDRVLWRTLTEVPTTGDAIRDSLGHWVHPTEHADKPSLHATSTPYTQLYHSARFPTQTHTNSDWPIHYSLCCIPVCMSPMRACGDESAPVSQDGACGEVEESSDAPTV
jgi:hypothetical protein